MCRITYIVYRTFPSIALLLLLPHRLLPAFHFFRRYVFNMGADPPLIAELILYSTHAITVELIYRFHQGSTTGTYCFLVSDISVGHIKKNINVGGWELVACIREHDSRIADAHFRMHDVSVFTVHPGNFFCIEGLFEKCDEVV